MESAPVGGPPILVRFRGVKYPLVVFRTAKNPDQWVRYLGFGKSALWPAIHSGYALSWTPLPDVSRGGGG